MPPPCCKFTVDLLTFKVVSESRVTWATSVPILVFTLPRPLCSRLRPDVRDRPTSDVRRRQTSDTHHHLMPPPYRGGGIIKTKCFTVQHYGLDDCPVTIQFLKLYNKYHFHEGF